MSSKTRTNEEIAAKSKNWNDFIDDHISLSNDEMLPSSNAKRIFNRIPLKRNNESESEPEDPCHGRPQSRFRRRQSRRRALGRSPRRTKKQQRSRSRKRF